jgi:hypothetical protein
VRAPEKPLDVRTPLPEVPRALAALAALVLGAALLAGCGPSDPAQEVEDARSRYSVEVASFSVDQNPTGDVFTQPPAMPEGQGEAEGEDAGADAADAADAAAEGEAMEMQEPVDLTQDVILDLLVRWNGRDPLAGITVDITHADEAGNEKGAYRAWIETAEVHRGPPTQMVHRLEDLDYVDGDGFHAEVRSPIPAGERAQYREFSEGGQ